MQKVLLVDDNPNVLYSFKRSLHSVDNQWLIVTAGSGAEALEIIAHEPINIIVSDLRMPEMDGVELLGTVAKISPSTLRVAITGEADPMICQQATLVAHQFIAKPISPQDFSKVINQIIGMNSLVIKPEIKRAITRIANLPSQPGLYTQLMAELSKQEGDLDYVSTVVSQDLGMTAKILQLVNSAYFGLAREVSEVSQAVFYLGMETIRDLAFSVHLFSQFEEGLVEKSGLSSLWDHSLKVATCSKAIVSSMIKDKKMIAASFTAGLLHDIGKLILGTTSLNFYRSMAQEGRIDPEQIMPQERKAFGSTHAEIGAYLLGIWGLPPEIGNAVLIHHDYEKIRSTEFSTLIAVWYANLFVGGFMDHKNAEGFQLSETMLHDDLLSKNQDAWKSICLSQLTR